jgi:hypothetical protein
MMTTTSAQRLLLEFLKWVSERPRTYADAMDAWRSSCPRNSIYEDALSDGLIELARRGTHEHDALVTLTARGMAAVRKRPTA